MSLVPYQYNFTPSPTTFCRASQRWVSVYTPLASGPHTRYPFSHKATGTLHINIHHSQQ